jgi:hypothetical protein
MEERRNMYEMLVRKAEVRKSLGRSALRWEGNIRMDLR